MQKEYGNHIGGSRKEIWSYTNGVSINTIRGMPPEEQKKYMLKKILWPCPDYQKLLSERPDATIEGLYALKTIYQAVPAVSPKDNIAQRLYIDFVDQIRQHAEKMPLNLHTITEYHDYWQPLLCDSMHAIDRADRVAFSHIGLVTSALWGATLYPSLAGNLKKIKKEQFLVPEKEKIPSGYAVYEYTASRRAYDLSIHPGADLPAEGTYFAIGAGKQKYGFVNKLDAIQFCQEDSKTKKKNAINIPKLSVLRREGLPDLRKEKDVTGDDIVQKFGLSGLELGNYVTDKNSQGHLNALYDALYDLSAILKVCPEEIGLGSKLSLAVGARGQGGRRAALAHYEPLMQVINLTKEKGPGSLGHEYMHAMDYLIGQHFSEGKPLTEYVPKHPNSLPSMQKVLDLMHRRDFHSPQEKQEALSKLQKRTQASIDSYQNSITQMILQRVPDDGLTKEEIEKRDKAIQDFLVPDANLDNANGSYEQKLDDLSNAVKELTGRRLPDKLKEDLYAHRYCLKAKQDRFDAMEKFLTKPETDFSRNAKALDNLSGHAKEYYQTDVEMFARAGAAYLADRLKQSKAVDDYLSGHADSIAVPLSDAAGTTLIYGAPQGKERQDINQAFSELFRDLRIRGLLCSKEYEEQKVVCGYVQDPDAGKKRFVIQQSSKDPSLLYYRMEQDPVQTLHVVPGSKNVASYVTNVLDKEGLFTGYTLYNSDAEMARDPVQKQKVPLIQTALEQSAQLIPMPVQKPVQVAASREFSR